MWVFYKNDYNAKLIVHLQLLYYTLINTAILDGIEIGNRMIEFSTLSHLNVDY